MHGPVIDRMGPIDDFSPEMLLWRYQGPKRFESHDVGSDAGNGFSFFEGDEIFILYEALEVLGEVTAVFRIHIHDDGGADTGEGVNLLGAELAELVFIKPSTSGGGPG